MISERLRTVQDVLHRLGPWFDRRSRRPLVLLTLVSFAVYFWPLAADVASRSSSRSRGSFAGRSARRRSWRSIAAGVGRLCWVRPADAWPSQEPTATRTAAARWIPWVLRLTVASLAIPIMRNPDGLGFADWDFVLDKFEAVRRTILVWHEFPWWNPWCRGGFPLAAEPQIGAVSMATPLVLALGTGIGLRVATILCIGIAVEGAYRLAWLWFREPWAAAAAASCTGSTARSRSTPPPATSSP